MILWDTAPLYAAFDRRDKHHEASAASIATRPSTATGSRSSAPERRCPAAL
jgi:hypothetical protein